MWPIRHFQSVDSTNDEARRLADLGEGGTFVVVADTQTAGRGRMGRQWESPAGCNLYFSLRKLFPPDVSPSSLTLAIGLAVGEALRAHTNLDVKLKWPNDIWVNGKKCGGVLAESRTASSGHDVIVGVGINVNVTRDQLSPEVAAVATSLRIESDREWDRQSVLHALLIQMAIRSKEWANRGFAPMREKYIEMSLLVGRHVTVDEGGREVNGVVVGVDHDGALLLQRENGIDRVIAGDVHVIRY